jgi:hypothetical protein
MRKRKILRPGSRGGRGFYTEGGEWTYGERTMPPGGHVAATLAARPPVFGDPVPELPAHEFAAVYAAPGQHPATVATVHAALADFPVALQRLVMDQGFLISIEPPPPDQPELLGQTFMLPQVPRVQIFVRSGDVPDPKEVVHTVRHELGHAVISAWARTIGTDMSTKAAEARKAWRRFELASRLEHGVTQYALAVELRDNEDSLAYMPHGFWDQMGDLNAESAKRAWSDEKIAEQGLAWGLSMFGMENFCEIMGIVQHAGGVDLFTGERDIARQRPRTWDAWKEVYSWMQSTASKIPNVA